MVLLAYPAAEIEPAGSPAVGAATSGAGSLPPAYQRVWALRSVGLAVTAVLAAFPYAIWSCFDVGFTVWFVDEFEYSVLTATLFFTIAPATYSKSLCVCDCACAPVVVSVWR